jgi:trypsin-like peptidase
VIIDQSTGIRDVAAFIAGLQAAARGVLRVTIGTLDQSQALSSAWLITDSLVVVPDYVVSTRWTDRPNEYFCVPDFADSKAAPDAKPIRAGLIHQPSGNPDGTRPALLRLDRPLSKRALRLQVSGAADGDHVFVLHHPQGVAELKLSIGKLVGQDAQWLRYDADTQNGSGGGPVLTGDWQVVAMHVRSSDADDPTLRFNEGTSLAAMIEGLRATSAWPEIAAHHGLADVGPATQEVMSSVGSSPSPTVRTGVLGSAVRWTFDPGILSAEDRERVRPLVIDPTAKRWVLLGNERERLIGSAPLTALRDARGTGDETDPGQQVIDRILKGPPYDLAEIDEAALPYWLQAVRWFASTVPELPTPAAIHRTLGRKRIRSRLDEIAGPGFRGRAQELATLRAWFDDPGAGPMAITGIGGVGKSALAAKLASDLPSSALLWLDFDRADVAPDDAVSVLTLIFDQLTLQVDGFRPPPIDGETWSTAVGGLGAALGPGMAPDAPILLVLDGFEVAQHEARHEEIWQLLELLLDQLPGTRVVACGRAPVTGVVLNDRPIRNLHILGLNRDDAATWLREHGVTSKEALGKVLEVSRGVPLILHLAARWLETGGKLKDLPDDFPATLVQGFLYQRILDRVIDPELKPVARDVLVLRRVTPDMLAVVVPDSLPKGVEPDAVFARLAREMGLVDDRPDAGPAGSLAGGAALATATTGTLQLRPEVRAATLRLLERADRNRVRTIDRRAAKWYAGQDLDEPMNRAELVYHLLRAGDLTGATAAWKDECAAFLLDAEDELPVRSRQARAWLHDRLEPARKQAAGPEGWEHDAAARIRAMLARGIVRGVQDVLAERSERSDGSVLALYDAWTRWRDGDATAAGAILAAAPLDDGPASRDRSALAASLALAAGDRRAADGLLAAIEDPTRWAERGQMELDTLSVTAARARLTVDLDREAELLGLLRAPGAVDVAAALRGVLPASEVVIPLLARQLTQTGSFESLGERIAIPGTPQDLLQFTADLDRTRTRPFDGPSFVLPLVGGAAAAGSIWSGADMAASLPWPFEPEPAASPASGVATVSRGRSLGLDLMVLAWRRWTLVSSGLFLRRAGDVLRSLTPQLHDPQQLAIVGTLGAFAGNEWSPFRLWDPDGGQLGPLAETIVLDQIPYVEPRPTGARLASVMQLVGTIDEGSRLLTLANQAATLDALVAQFRSGGPELEGLGPYLLSPDPLDILLRRILGVPDGVEL